MNKELLRIKLLEAWSKGYIIAGGDIYDWGFCCAMTGYEGFTIYEFLGVTGETYFNSPEFDATAIAVSKEILNSPLMRELS